MSASSSATAPRASGMALGHRWSFGLLMVLAILAVALPILLAVAPVLADALGGAGRTALFASVLLTLGVVGAFAYAHAHRVGGRLEASMDRRLLVAGGIGAIVVLAIFPAQLSVFALAWPAPETAAQYFELLQERPLVGLLSLDLLLMLDWIVLLAVWAGLFVALRRTAPRTMVVVLGVVLLSAILYFLSNTAFEMVSLSAQYAVASDAERVDTLAEGEAALATFEGLWFTVSYILSGLAVFVASVVMWRTPGFGKLIGGVGIAYGAMQLVPPNLGTIGMALSLLSLLPMLVWLALVARDLLRLGRTEVAA